MSDIPTFFCSECGTPLKPDQVDALKQGEEVLCEQCGKSFHIDHISEQKGTAKGSSAQQGFDFKKIGLDIQANMKKSADNAKNFFKSLNPLKKESPPPRTVAPKPAPQKVVTPPTKAAAPKPPPQKVVTPPPKTSSNPNNSPPPMSNNQNTPNRKVYTQAPEKMPARELPKPISRFRKFNDFSAIFALLIAVIVGLVLLLPLALQNQIITFEDFRKTFLSPVVRIVLILIVVLYDGLYARRKVLKMEMESYGLDMVIAGGVGSILAWGAGVFLVIKGFIVMGRALVDKERNPQYYGDFSAALFKGFNAVGGIYGFAVLFLNLSVYFEPATLQLTLIYAYMALFAIIGDMAVLVPLVFMSKKQSNYPIAFALIICGILACFFQFAGILIVAQGAILVLISVFSPE